MVLYFEEVAGHFRFSSSDVDYLAMNPELPTHDSTKPPLFSNIPELLTLATPQSRADTITSANG